MKTKLFTIAAFTFFFGACTKTDMVLKTDSVKKTSALQQAEAIDPLQAKSKFTATAIDFNAPQVFPEGVVYDQFNDRFLVSSIAMGTIGSVNREGVYSPFVQDANLVSTAGMEIDKAHKRLLVTNAAVDGSVAQLLIYDLNSGTRLHLVNLIPVANDGAPHLANDVAIDQQGNAYVTDSYAGNIYKVDPSGNATVFYHNAAFTPAPGGFGFNGIEFSNSKGGYLLVAHTALKCIVKIPIDNPAALTTVQLPASVTSPDGLLLSKDNNELIIVNNTAQNPGSKVLSFETNDSWATGTSTGEFGTEVVYPTTVTSDGKTEYVLYSYIHLLFGGVPQALFTIQPLPFTSNHPY